jgi:serine/threonine-protein kinase/endoribonuclease IRE1
MWKFHSDRPLVQTIYDRTESEETRDWKWIVEPSLDGSLYIFVPGVHGGMQKLSPTVKELAELSPYVNEESPFVYTAQKSNSLFILNATNGAAKKWFSPEGSGVETSGDCLPVKRLGLEEDNKCDSGPTINLGRTEYTVSISNRDTGSNVCTIKYFEWTPNTRDRDLQDQYSTTMDGKYIYTRYNGDIIALQYRGKQLDEKPLYQTKLPSPVVRVFDVARPRGMDTPENPLILLPQPIAPPVTSKPTNNVFVNRTESGSWYALSESNYPSVTDGAFEAKCYQDLDHTLSAFELEGVHSLSTVRKPNLLLPGPDLLSSISEHPSAPTNSADFLRNTPLTIDPPLSPLNLANRLYLTTHGAVVALVLCVVALATAQSYKKWKSIGAPSIPIRETFRDDIALERRRVVRFDEPVVDLENQPLQLNDQALNGVERPEGLILHDQANGINRQVPRINLDIRNGPEDLNGSHSPLVQAAEAHEDLAEDDEAVEDTATEGSDKPKRKSKKRGTRGGRGKKKKFLKEQEAENKTPAVEAVAQLVPQVDQNMTPDNDPEVVDITDVEPGWVRVSRNVEYDTRKILGLGSGGTYVYDGRFKGKTVAVKRMVRPAFDLQQQEIHALQTIEFSRNVVKYYEDFADRDFLYLVVEKCQATLFDIFGESGVRSSNEICPLDHGCCDTIKNQIMLDVPGALFQLVEGLAYLHNHRIIHRDIKPHNILVAFPKPHDPNLRLVIADFGLCKTLPDGASTLAVTTGAGAGTSGWRAPEQISAEQIPRDHFNESRQSDNGNDTSNSNEGSSNRLKRALDVFCMGIVFYYIITEGSHPFDPDDKTGYWPGDRNKNIFWGRSSFTKLRNLGPEGELAAHMIRGMLSQDPEDRPSAKAVKEHPFFWEKKKVLNFLCEVSDFYEREVRDPPSHNLQILEAQAPTVIGPGGDFLAILDKKFVLTLGKQRKYNADKLLDLLRALRNKKNHYLEMDEDIKTLVGNLHDGGYLRYWQLKFPNLLTSCYTAVLECQIQEDFPDYFA